MSLFPFRSAEDKHTQFGAQRNRETDHRDSVLEVRDNLSAAFAMACSRPCLVSDRVGCAPDLVIARKTGLVFPHGNVAALATAMVELARNPSQIVAMGENAHNRLRNYSVGVAVEGVLESLAATIGPVGKLCPH